MWERASVYSSSSSTLAGRFIRFGGGGGGMRDVSRERFVRALDGVVDAIAIERSESGVDVEGTSVESVH